MVNVRGLRVRNTFIEFCEDEDDESDGPDDSGVSHQPSLGRHQSEPAKSASSLLLDLDVGDDDDGQPTAKLNVRETYERGAEWDWAPSKGAAAPDAAGPPEQEAPADDEQPGIFRLQTWDHFEAPSMLGAAPPAYTLPDRGNWPATPLRGVPPQLPPPDPSPAAMEYANRIKWGVDAGQLAGDERKLMSPTFDVTTNQGHVAKFKMMLHPKVMSDGRMSSFRQSLGRGKLAVKFLEERSQLPLSEAVTLALRISVGGAGPRPEDGVVHDFLNEPEYTLPADIEEWDFGALVNREVSKLIVCIELLVL
mmetsp:Transcript_117853/g.334155  ORF Transcript_117853/g.334155 Transcript_117853/m.334155 type:complete len:307 (+) Transcript_117853:60-980(+)